MSSEKRDVLFILDGGPNHGDVCSIRDCLEVATGLYEMVDADTMEFLGAVVLCEKHGKKFATGGSG